MSWFCIGKGFINILKGYKNIFLTLVEETTTLCRVVERIQVYNIGTSVYCLISFAGNICNYLELYLPLQLFLQTLFMITLQYTYPFRKALDIIKEYEAKEFYRLRVTTCPIRELRVIYVNFTFNSLYKFRSNRKYT